MNKTHKLIAVVSAVGLIVLLFLLPRNTEVVVEENADSDHANHTAPENGAMKAELENALQLISGEAPMQGILALRDVADKYPEEPEPQFYLGMFAMQTAQFEKAIERFSNVVALQSDYPSAWKMLGQAYLELEQYKEAAESFHTYLEIFPGAEDRNEIEEILEEIK